MLLGSMVGFVRAVAARVIATGLIVVTVAGFSAQASSAEPSYITVASTTSTQNSGLFRHILPKFTEVSGIEVRVVAVGTGAAIRLARSGDADVLLVHHKASEENFVAEGSGVRRYPVMFNDFVIVGPRADPVGIARQPDAAKALVMIAQAGAAFVSRGDNSGTHKREVEIWAMGGIDPSTASGTWYRQTGSGMGAALNVGAAMSAYALSDRGTWLSFTNKRDLEVLVEGDPRLRNEYGVILVSKKRHSHVKAREGQAFIDWLLSAAGRAAINGFRIGGKRLFTAIE
ncbi:MAG: substrate-binding domain-containing protein [Proteobacteria bacterium]|nr:substrate-binding domain-containing protein [Pseudomonadota bacterium]